MSIISSDSVIIRQAKNIKNLRLTDIATKAIEDNKNDIIKAQQEQLQEGKRGDGKKIKPDYSPFTAGKKGFKTPNLFDSGDMYNQMDVIVGIPNDSEYSLISDVDYFPKLNEKYDKAFDLYKPYAKVPSINNEFLKLYHEAINK